MFKSTLRIGALLALLLWSAGVYALRPGDMATPLAPPMEYLQGAPFALNGKAPADAEGEQPLRLAVFLLCRAPGSVGLLQQLGGLQRQYGDKLRIALVTPDPVEDAKNLVKSSGTELTFAVDRGRGNTPRYMAGSLLFPYAFAIAPDGEIIWCGEAVDAPEMVERYCSGAKFGQEQRRIAELIDEMQNYLRGGDERQLKRCTEEILKLESGHPGALRIRNFVLESSGRITEAWQLLDTEINRSPQLARLYVSAFDLISRHAELADRLPELLEKFARNVTEPRYLVAMAWGLLNRFDANIVALRRAQEFLRAAKSDEPTPEWESAYALLQYRLGDLKNAALHAEKAAKLYENANPAAAESRSRAEFYREALKLAE